MEESVGKISNLRSVAKVLERFIISIPAALFQHCVFLGGGGGEGVCKIKYELLKSKNFVMGRYSIQRPKYFCH